MMKKSLSLLLLLIGINIFSQSKENDIQKITKTIQNYYDGYIYRDISKLNKAFDTINGTMKVPIVTNGKVTGYANNYFKDLQTKWGNREKLSKEVLQNCSLTILNIDVVDGVVASAKISMKVDTVTYIDILSLEVMNNQWKITNKIYATRK
ncbi:MAG: nuclear transport factor 2 family protein [Flavobacteriaceae bacterium]|nr:nuclear transport factor 2 family protein [Flavobacteriaceae bacterium]